MSIIITGLEMPTERESFNLTIKYNGTVLDTETGIQVAEAQEIPPHGRLGDLDELERKIRENIDKAKSMEQGAYGWWYACNVAEDFVLSSPTIIEAELPVHHGTFAATSEQEAIRRLTGEDET